MRSNPPPSHGRSEHLQAWKVERATLPCSSAGTSHSGVGLGEDSFPVQGGQVLYLNYQGPTHMQEVYLLCSSSGTSTEVTLPCPEPGHRAMMAAWISLPPTWHFVIPPTLPQTDPCWWHQWGKAKKHIQLQGQLGLFVQYKFFGPPSFQSTFYRSCIER